MTDFRNDLLIKITEVFGFGERETIWFTYLCEKCPNTQDWNEYLQDIVDECENDPFYSHQQMFAATAYINIHLKKTRTRKRRK